MTSAARPVPHPLRLVRTGAGARSHADLLESAQLAEVEGRRDDAREMYELALARLPEAGAPARASDILRWIARTHRVDANLELALDCADAALAVAEAHGDEAAIGNAVNLQAIIHWQQGLLDEAERLYHVARQSALRAGEAKLSAMIAQNLGVIANVRGDLDTALQHYESSLDTYRALGLAKDVCVALNNIGLLYTQRQQWALAATAYDEATSVAEGLGDNTACVQIDVNRAEGLMAQGRHAEARAACEHATARSARIQDAAVLGELYKAYGIVERETGNYERADQFLREAKRVAAQRQDILLLAETTKECAELHRQQGRNRDTLQSLNQAHRLFGQLRARRELADIGRRMEKLESGFLEVVRKWGESIESKDEYTQGHCQRVAALACAIAARAGMDEQSLFWLHIGALLHDVGKLVIPRQILNKAGALTPDEWAMMRNHPTVGVEMLADVDFPCDVRPIVQSHHERWDGRGYPQGLQGEAIPFEARILCIADVYDALTSQRSYKKAMTPTEAIDVMRLEVSAQFDPQLFALFEEVAPAFASVVIPAALPRLVPGTNLAPVHRDELTELPLRRAFSDAAAAALGERKPDETVALLVVDVDRFKTINDTYGHLRGDEVLRGVAKALRAQQRDRDFLGRYAGDEFVLVLPHTTRHQAIEIADALRVAVHAVPIADDGAAPLALTISIGVGVAPEHGSTVEHLFASADAALLDAKRQGRDRVICSGHLGASNRPKPRVEHFVGRHAERRILVDRLDQAVRCEPRIVSVIGEAGVGKSALVREIAPEIRLRCASLVTGRCVDSATAAAYDPWFSLLDTLRMHRLVADRPWRALPRLIPALGHAALDERDDGPRALFAEVSEYLRLAAANRPLVLVIDDMQWADAASWDLLEYVVGHLDRERILICLTIRSEDLRGDVLQRRRRLSRDEGFDELSLERLTPEQVAQWLGGVLEQEVDRDMLRFLVQRTEGNPFMLAHFLRLAIDDERLTWTPRAWRWQPGEADRVPTPVRDILARRLASLSPASAQTLAALAALGRTVDIDRAVSAGIATEEALLAALEEGVDAAILDASSLRSKSRLRFNHGLLVELLNQGVHSRRLERARAALNEPVSTIAKLALDTPPGRRSPRRRTGSDAASDR